LSDLAERVQLSEAQCVQTLCDTELRVYAMGFMPGFAYMATLPPSLHVPRRATPRTRVAPQTVAIANGMAGIYPWPSPGGWYLLGHMPVPLFDTRLGDQATLFCAGDRLNFHPVDAQEAQDLIQAIERDPNERWRFLESAP
jgi:KipI family sensor histidine kinase inhibitor